jgi:hypothetical protein
MHVSLLGCSRACIVTAPSPFGRIDPHTLEGATILPSEQYSKVKAKPHINL